MSILNDKQVTVCFKDDIFRIFMCYSLEEYPDSIVLKKFGEGYVKIYESEIRYYSVEPVES